MKKPEVKNNKNGQNGKKKGPHKKQGGADNPSMPRRDIY